MLFRSTKAALNLQRRFSSSSGLPSYLYNNVWRKSNIFYVTYIFAGCVVIEAVYGTLTNAIWESANRNVSLIILLVNY